MKEHSMRQRHDLGGVMKCDNCGHVPEFGDGNPTCTMVKMNQGKKVHFSMNIEGALRNKSFKGFTNDDGTEATEQEAKNFLLEQQRLGRRVIPMGACDSFNYETGCPGHEY